MIRLTEWHQIKVKAKDRFSSQDRMVKCQIWCTEQFGKRWAAGVNHDGRWLCYWSGPRDHSHYSFHFRDHEDAVLFTLRWG